MQKSEDLTGHYDEVIEFYQSVLAKERVQIEEDKKKKLREVELWTRAIREEEKIVVEQYAKERGDREGERIREAMRLALQEKLKHKHALESARGVFEAHMAKAMEGRREEWEERREEFMKAQMDELKEQILNHARDERRKV